MKENRTQLPPSLKSKNLEMSPGKVKLKTLLIL